MTLRAKRIEQLCTIPHHIPGDVHRNQMQHANQRISELQAEVDALKAMLGWEPAKETGRVLSELAAAFRVGEEAGWPTVSTSPSDSQKVTVSKSASKQPTGGNRSARNAVFALQRKVEENIDSFNARKDNHWQHPHHPESNEG